MGYDLFWSFVVFAILISAVIYYGITDAPPEDGRKTDAPGNNAVSRAEASDSNDKETGPDQDRDKSP